MKIEMHITYSHKLTELKWTVSSFDDFLWRKHTLLTFFIFIYLFTFFNFTEEYVQSVIQSRGNNLPGIY